MLCAPDEFVGPSNVHAFRSLLCHAPVPCFARRCDPCLMSEADGSSQCAQRGRGPAAAGHDPVMERAGDRHRPRALVPGARRLHHRALGAICSLQGRDADRQPARRPVAAAGRRTGRPGGLDGSGMGCGDTLRAVIELVALADRRATREARKRRTRSRRSGRPRARSSLSTPRAAPRTATAPTGPIWSARWHSSRRRRPACTRL